VPAASCASSAVAASHRFAEKSRWIARSSRSDVPLRYASISLPVPVVRSGERERKGEGRRRAQWWAVGGHVTFFVSVCVAPGEGSKVWLCSLTWEFAPGDGDGQASSSSSCRGEMLCEELCLRGLS
jgi:hypothetical protein